MQFWKQPKRRNLQFSQPASDPDGSATLPFVIPTGADPDFLLRGLRQKRVRGFP
jgi:hypothetical protein